MHPGVLTTAGSEIILPCFLNGCRNNTWETVFDCLSGSLHLVVSPSGSKACELLECITEEDWIQGIAHEKTNSCNFGRARHRSFPVYGVLPRITRLGQSLPWWWGLSGLRSGILQEKTKTQIWKHENHPLSTYSPSLFSNFHPIFRVLSLRIPQSFYQTIVLWYVQSR